MHEEVIHGEAIAGRAASVRRDLLRLSGNVAVHTLDLAVLLHEVQTNGYAQEWGFASLADYAKRELGLKPRKSQYLSKIISVMLAAGLKREQFEKAGTSKLREISTLDPSGSYWNQENRTNEPLDSHIVRLVLDADEMTVEQVKEEVLRLKGMVGPNRMVIRSCSVTQSAWENVIQPAYELARRILGSQSRDDSGNAVEYKDGACLEVICAAFLSDVNNQPDPGDGIESVTEEAPTPLLLPMENI